MASTRRVAAVQNSHSNSHNNNNNDAGMEESPHHVSARTWRPTRRGGRRPLRHTPTRHTPNSTSRQPLRASSLSGQREKGARSGGNAGGTASDSAGGDSHATRRRRALPSSIPRVFMRGVLAALSLHKCLPLFFLSRLSRMRTAQCFLLNGVMFLGSIMLTNSLVLPAIDLYRQMLGIDAEANAMLVGVVNTGALVMFQLFWFLPMYLISFLLSAKWYNDIAREAFKYSYDPRATTESGNGASYFSEIAQQKRAPVKNLVTLVMEELYRMLLMVVLLIQVTLLAFIPVVGNVLSFFLCCFVYSFYSFEYKWALEGVPLTLRMEMLEQRWVFLLGFGAPFTLATFSFSFFVSGGIYALLFPVNIILAMVTRPQRHVGTPSSLPLFRIPKRVALWLLRFLGPWLGAPSPSPTSGFSPRPGATTTATRRAPTPSRFQLSPRARAAQAVARATAAAARRAGNNGVAGIRRGAGAGAGDGDGDGAASAGGSGSGGRGGGSSGSGGGRPLRGKVRFSSN